MSEPNPNVYWTLIEQRAVTDMLNTARRERDEAKAERDALLERLGPVDPGGSDRVDELEGAIGWLRDDRNVVMARRDELLEALQAVQDCLGKIRTDAGTGNAYHLRDANALINDALTPKGEA